jgi:hypothetical protein
MYCSSCGARVPRGRGQCSTCGTPAPPQWESARAVAQESTSTRAVAVGGIAVCPRCHYQGEGLSYFTRGAHVVALVAATVFTLPMAAGAGGVLYFALRHDHRLCPRCGVAWGKHGSVALNPTDVRPERGTRSREIPPAGRTEAPFRITSIFVGIVAALLLMGAIAEGELILLLFGVLTMIGAFYLKRSGDRIRDRRREAILAALQTQVVKLAGERRGVLTVTDVSVALGWPLRRAEKVLQSLDDGWRVDSDVTDEGVIVYRFAELMISDRSGG